MASYPTIQLGRVSFAEPGLKFLVCPVRRTSASYQ